MTISRFPAVSGSSLEGHKFDLPAGFEGKRNLVIVAFQQWHQQWVDTWLPAARRLEQEDPTLRVYELPTIQRLNLLARTWIDWGMRAAIADKRARESTITLYIEKEPFRAALAIPDESTIHLFLVEADGAIVWRSEGPADEAKIAALQAALGPAAVDPATSI